MPSSGPGHLVPVSLYSSSGDPREGFPGYCASTPPDWSGEQARAWPGRHGQVYGPFRQGLIKEQKLDDERRRGLAVGVEVASRKPICSAQPPLVLLQYSESRALCEVCVHCRRFCGSLASAVRRCLEAAGSSEQPEDLVEDPRLLEEIEVGEWEVRSRVPCKNGCGAVFCSSDCEEAGHREGWHRALCTDLSPERRKVWPFFQKHAARHHEQFVAAAQVIGEIISLVKYSDVALYEAMAYFSRFAKMSWIEMLNLPSKSATEAAPGGGKLGSMAAARRHKRHTICLASLELLSAMLWEPQFEELLTLDYYSHVIGQFSLSNVWVEIEHPLSQMLKAKSDDLAFRQRYGRLLVAACEAANKVVSEAKGDTEEHGALKDDEAQKEPSQSKEATTQQQPQEEPPPGAEGNSQDDAWSLPKFEGSALYPCVALSNHSCKPNFTMRYADGCLADMMALRNISAGEELNLAYVSPNTALSERLAALWRHWGFVCTCRKCQDEIMERAVRAAGEEDEFFGEGGIGAASGGRGYPEDLPKGVRLSPAGVAAAKSVRASNSSASSKLTEVQADEAAVDEDDGSQVSEEHDDGDSSEQSDASSEMAFKGGAGFAPFAGPRHLPDSVKKLEDDLKEMMNIFDEDGEEDKKES
eukprot:TRINITY_DN16565_c0_g3_i1.p1 TRINITY_DN16565_c0_g3~~TRINITY_DN16565_c0_g3_i1.p1  ORF type:complete len:641 (+),score=164.53 TRINITY_DN16565_c0_g3_i1:97-2019(+)